MVETKTRINALIDSKKKPYSRENLKEIVLFLRKNHSFEQISEQTGIPKTTLFNYTKKQNVKKISSVELERSIMFFEDFVPQGNEIDKVKKLIIHLIDLVGEPK